MRVSFNGLKHCTKSRSVWIRHRIWKESSTNKHLNIIQDLDRMGEQTLQLSMGNEQSPNLADLYSVDFTICRFIPSCLCLIRQSFRMTQVWSKMYRESLISNDVIKAYVIIHAIFVSFWHCSVRNRVRCSNFHHIATLAAFTLLILLKLKQFSLQNGMKNNRRCHLFNQNTHQVIMFYTSSRWV